MSTSKERSAEWLRGRLSVMEEFPLIMSNFGLESTKHLLAAAEAREATQPTEAEVKDD